MENLINEFMSQKTYAIAGSFRNEEKYAYKLLKKLIQENYVVYPVNPRIKGVENLLCYASILDLPEGVDVVNLVTPPEVTNELVKQCLQKGIKRVWMQPGAESENAIKFCKESGIKAVYNACMILQKRSM